MRRLFDLDRNTLNLNGLIAALLIVATQVVVTGCATQAGLGRARVLDVGQLEYGGAMQAQSTGAKLGPGPPIQLPWVQLMAVARTGVRPDLELGGRLWAMDVLSLGTFGLSVDGKWQMRRGEWIDVALGSNLQWQRSILGGWPWHSLGVVVPLLVGLNLGRHQLIGSVRSGVGALFGESMRTQWLGLSAVSLGFSLALGRWQLVPEVIVGWSPVGWNGTHADVERTGATVFELSVGIMRR